MSFFSSLRTTLLVGVMLAATSAWGQVSTYSFSRTSGTFQVLTPDTIVGGYYTDESIFTIPTKFPLRFADTVVDRIRISPNGVVGLGAAGTFSTGSANGFINYNNPNGRILASREGINRNIVAAFNGNLQATRDGEFGVKWNVAAVPGQRSLIVQWRNYKRYGSRFNGDTLTFQAEFKEDGRILLKYGRMVVIQGILPIGIQVGLRGQGPTDLLTVKGSWSTPTTGSDKRDSLQLTNAAFPVSGSTYTFTPPAPGPSNLAVLKAFVATTPASVLNCSYSTPLTIGVVVYNWGTGTLNTAQVGYRIGQTGTPVSGSSSFTPILQPYTTDTIYFSGAQAFVPPGTGTYSLVGFATVPNDPIRRNDTARSSAVVRGPVPVVLFSNVTDISTARRQGWRQGQGIAAPTRDSVNFFRSGSPTGFGSVISGYVNAGNPTALPQWYYLPSRTAGGPITINFRAGVTLNFSGNQPTSVEDDTLKLVVSRDCGQTWQTITKFDQRDVTSGRIANAPQDFSFQITNVPATFTVAFYYTSKGTGAANNYRWHLDNINFSAANDAAAEAIGFSAGRFPGCALSTQEAVSVQVRNQGSLPITSIQGSYVLNGRTVTQTFTLTPPLQPGQTRTLTFSGTNGADLSIPGTYRFTAYVNLNQDGSTANDTTFRVFNTAAGVAIPGPTRVADLPQARTAGWKLANGNPITSDTSLFWRAAFLTGNNAIGMFVDNTPAANNLYEWFYRPGTRTTGQVGITFRMAVSEGWGLPFTRPTAATLGDDTLKLVVSSDCGSSWQTIARYSAASLAANVVNDTLKTFAYTLTNTASSLQVAFIMNGNHTTAPEQYRWILDDIFFISANDLQAAVLDVPALRFTGCALSTQTPVRVQVRNAGSTPASQAIVGYRVENGPVVSQTLNFTPALQPGATQLVTFSGAQGADLSAFTGSVTLRGIVALTGNDGNHFNDTLSRVFNAGASAVVPVSDDTVKRLLDARAMNWRMAQGDPIAKDTNYIWRSQTINTLGGEVITASVADSIRNQAFWFYRTGMQTAGPISLRFDAAVIRVQTNGPRVDNIGTDTLDVLVSRDCGQSWQIIRRFSQLDVVGERIDSTMRQFGGQILPEPGNFSIAFRLKTGNVNTVPYRWVFDNIIISTRTDVTVAQIAAPSNPSSQYCIGEPLPVAILVTNAGIQQVDSVTAVYRVDGGQPISQSFRVDLPSGGQRLISFDPSNWITGVTGAFTIRVQLINHNEGTDDTANNRAVLTYSLDQIGTLPQGPYFNPNTMGAQDWAQQRRNSEGILIGTNYWQTGRAFLATSIAVNPLPNGNELEQRYLLSPYFAPSSGVTLTFESAVTTSLFSSAVASQGIGNDTLMLVYRTDCGPWIPFKIWTQADLAAGGIDNTLRPFAVAVPFATGDTVQVAFVVSNGGTDYAAPYAWHITRFSLSDLVATPERLDQRLGLAPNPARDQVRITLPGMNKGTVRLLTLQGARVRSTELADGQAELALADLPRGLYLVEVLTLNGRAVKRLVVE